MVIMKLATSFRLSKQAHEILALLSEQKGISKASVIEIALRELAAREKLRG
jgi:predicted DNA-binding protein